MTMKGVAKPLSGTTLIHTGEKLFVQPVVVIKKKLHAKSNLKKHFECKQENQQKHYVRSFEGCKTC